MCHILETLSDSRWHFGLSLSGISLKAIRIIDLQSLCHLQLLTLFLLTICIIIAVSQSVLHSGSQLGTVSPPGAFLKCLVTFFVCVAMPEGKLLTFSGKRPGMLRSQQSMRQHAQLSAQNVRSIPIKKQWTSWIGTPVLGWLNWFLPLKQVIYSGPLQRASGPRQWLGLLSPSFGFSLRGEGYLAKRNSGNVLVLVYPIPFCWEADAENSASGRFTDTCLLRCLQLHKWKLTQQVQKMNVSVISFAVTLSPNRRECAKHQCWLKLWGRECCLRCLECNVCVKKSIEKIFLTDVWDGYLIFS